MAAAKAAVSALPLSSACTSTCLRSSAHQRCHASGPTSTSGSFSHVSCQQKHTTTGVNLQTLEKRAELLHFADAVRLQTFERQRRLDSQDWSFVKVRAARGGVLDKPGGGGGAGVLEKPPALDTSWLEKLYQTESGGEGSKEKQNKRTGGGDQFRVLLVDSPKHTEKRVTSVLPKVIPNITSDVALGIFEESKVKGVGIVIVCVKEYAETYCQMLIRNGLSSRIEPDQDTL